MTSEALSARGVTKRFGPVTVLDGVDLSLKRGEVHGLLGENGSGKSTLIKILCGFHAPDSGELEVDGHPEPFPLSAARVSELGLRFVHQDLGFVPSLTVAENFHLGQLALGRAPWLVSERAMGTATRSALDRYHVDLDPKMKLGRLSGLQKALLAVVRAVHDLPHCGGILVLDEPTVFLPHSDVADLFDLVRRIASDGGAVVLVSHDLGEIQEVTDRVSVLRDGRLVGSRPTEGASQDDMIEMIVGRRIASGPDRASSRPSPATDRALVVDGLTAATIRPVTFELRKGEILGIAGLEGSGAEAIPYLLYGVRPAGSGRLHVGEHAFDLPRLSPAAALRAGMVLIPADRRRLAGLLRMSVEENLTFPRLARFRAGPLLRRAAIRRDAVSLIDRFDIRPRRAEQSFGTLSGGNQQKAVMAKWLAVEPQVLLLHEPTQGVDVGARRQIHAYLHQAASTGQAVLCASSDFEQLAGLCDRVLVFRQGRLAEQLSGPQLSKEAITEACLVERDMREVA